MKRIVSLILLFTITCLSITYVAHGAVSGSIDGNGENHIKIISLPIEFNGKCDDKISVYSLTHDCLLYNKITESCKSKFLKVASGNSIVLQKIHCRH